MTYALKLSGTTKGFITSVNGKGDYSISGWTVKTWKTTKGAEKARGLICDLVNVGRDNIDIVEYKAN